MKKLVCFLFVLTFVVALSSCTNVDTSSVSANDLLLSVLNSETTFTAEDGKNVLLIDFAYGYDGNVPLLADPQEYTFVDMDGDGTDELIADITPTQTAYIVLHEEDGTVYGYLFYVRTLLNLKADGSFMQSGGLGITNYARMQFDNSSCEIINTASVNVADGIYEINETVCTAEELNEYEQDWNAKADAQWVRIS